MEYMATANLQNQFWRSSVYRYPNGQDLVGALLKKALCCCGISLRDLQRKLNLLQHYMPFGLHIKWRVIVKTCWSNCSLIQEAEISAATLRSYSISHVRRESNQVAHCLARHAQHNSDSYVWHEECSKCYSEVGVKRCIQFC